MGMEHGSTAHGRGGDLDALLDELRDEVRRRRAAGEYPPGLEQELDRHFREQVPERFDPLPLEERLRALDRAADIGRHRISSDSATALGSAVHRGVARLVTRQTDGILTQLGDLAVAVRDLLHVVVERLPDEDVRGMSARVDLILDRIADYERGGPEADGAARDLRVRVTALEEAFRRLAVPPWSTVAPLLDSDDGSALDEIRQRLHLRGDVVEVVPSRGEDAAVLESRADDSLDAIVLLHGVALLSPRRLGDLVAAATHRLRAGGRLVVRASAQSTASTEAWLPGVPAAAVVRIVTQAGFGTAEVEGPLPDDAAGWYIVVATR